MVKALKVNFNNIANSEEVVFVEDNILERVEKYLNLATKVYCVRYGDKIVTWEQVDISGKYNMENDINVLNEETFNWIEKEFGIKGNKFEGMMFAIEDNGSKMEVFP